MEVVASSPSSGGGSPFQHRDVREWSRLDSITGVLERARLETDHWAASAAGQKHQYGKVVDSRARTGVEGRLQQRRQLEVFQSQVPGGRLQVVRTHTVASRSWSSSNNSTSTTVASSAAPAAIAPNSDFENLELAVNPLDLSSQKSKASVGRSGGRRPPTRPRLREEAAKSIHRVSRLCHQLHEEAVQKTFKGSLLSERRESGDGSAAITYENETTNSNESDELKQINGHSNLGRTKSNSSGDLHKSYESINQDDLDDFEQLENWRRTSKVRRSWQFPKQSLNTTLNISTRPPDLPVNTGNVRKIKEDLETGRRLNTALRGNNVDLDALDQILQSISSSSSIYSDIPSSNETPERDTNSQVSSLKKNKKSAFITVESLQAVRGRLKPLAPVHDIIATFENKSKDEEIDDGIETEDVSVKQEEMTTSEMPTPRVRSNVYGMEAMLNRKPVTGTGSLESRSSNKSSGSGGSRTEDWYNRRKSYAFEQVQNQQEQNSIALKSKSKVESSTDSGICRSTEIVAVPPDVKNDSDIEPDRNEKYRYGKISSVQVNRMSSKETSLFSAQKTKDDVSSFVISFKDGSQTLDSNWKQAPQRDSESGTITIPITSDSSNRLPHFDSGKRFFESNKENDDKLAADESKYAPRTADTMLYPPRVVLNDTKFGDNLQDAFEDETSIFNKKQKKVEFSKTEVHFAAESGRVNIVETDEKPPPTNNFRRRRRNSGVAVNQMPPEDSNRNGLPVLHFGDSTYEKTLFGVSDPGDAPSDTVPQQIENSSDAEPQFDAKTEYAESNTVTVNSHSGAAYSQNADDEWRDLSESEIQIRGILKNKPVKPKPYHLGDNDDHLNGISSSDDLENKWGVKLKHVQQKEEARMWTSTVALRSNTFEYSQPSDIESDPSEIQQLLKSLKPARKSVEPVVQINANDSNGVGVKIVSPIENVQRSATAAESLLSTPCSVADRVKQVEYMHWTLNKGYSTKVNFGGGEATVVENNAQEYAKPDRYTTWPRKEEPNHDRKQTSILNKGLVVRIGHDTMCSKTTTNHDNNTTTTTKITIDLSPSPTTHNNAQPVFKSVKLPRATLHSLKSTSLIMNTFSKPDNNETTTMTTVMKQYQRDETQSQNGFKPWRSDKESAADQLAALRRLYDDADQSDSEKADEEVRSYMSGLVEENGLNEFKDDASSVVSGSWSKMRAYKNMKQHLQNQSKPSSFASDNINDKRLEKDFVNLRISTENTTCSSNKKSHDVTETLDKSKLYAPTKLYKCDLKSAATNEKLSSPSLVGQNAMGNKTATKEKPTISDISKYFAPQPKDTPSVTAKLPTQERSHLLPPRTDASHNVGRASSFSAVTAHNKTTTTTKSIKHPNVLRYPSKKELVYYFGVIGTPPTPKVLRYPRKSELVYFGVPASPEANANAAKTSDKRAAVAECKANLADKFKSSFAPIVAKPLLKPKTESPSLVSTSPIYENVDIVKKDSKKICSVDYRKKKEYDSSIMDDLNNAANEILQAVNGYSQEESQLSDEERTKVDILETISETKSWKQTNINNNNNNSSNSAHDTREGRRGSLTQNGSGGKIKHSSSNSSIDSIAKEYRKTTQSSSLKQRSRVEMTHATAVVTTTSSSAEKQKKKITSAADPALSKATKARRLQRASSREALLQSHGSSSEDLSKSVEAPVRKPRLVRKTKSMQPTTTTMSNGSVASKESITAHPKKSTVHTPSERLPGVPLPEIRHKTTITTIKSTAEKQALREAKAQKLKLEEQKRTKRIATTRKDLNSSKSVSSPSSTAHRTKVPSTSSPNARDGSRNTGANVKKSARTEGLSRH